MQQDQSTDSTQQQSFIPCGWIGGFSERPPRPYPNSELLSSLPLEGNLCHIPNIKRMLRAKWPEFSWEVTKGDPSTRMYQMFSPDISRLGYDDYGRVWSIICPQQGIYFPKLGITMNIEVTVTGNRGWINELAPQKELFAADITVKPSIWFSPDSVDGFFWQQLLTLNNKWGDQLPLTKKQGIRIKTCNEDNTNDIVQVRMGEHLKYAFPDRAKHWRDYAWAVANLGITIGNINSLSDTKVDEFNRKVLALFNVASGNLLKEGTVLIWNLWAGSPELVDRDEWEHHAEYWRYSIDVNHRPPEGVGTEIADFNGVPFNADGIDLDLKATEFALWVGWQLL